jgi:L-asparaginase
MPTVRVLTTGGTIATRTGADGNTVARATGEELLEGFVVPEDVRVEVENVFTIGSFRMTLDRVHALATRVIQVLQDPDVAGVVVTHGTDTLEETAAFLDLFIAPGRPVVLTGAQRTADAPGNDGPSNLRDSIVVAADAAVEGLGVLISFDGAVFPAWGTHKLRTVAATAFGASSSGHIGWVHADMFRPARPAVAPPRLPINAFQPQRARADIVPCYPDADATAMESLIRAGARGIVLEGVGAGNANPALCSAVLEAVDHGVVVVTSTRVPSGPVFPIYGDGGGADLLKAGAIPMGPIRPSHARILLAALLGVHGEAGTVRREIARYLP